MALTAGARLGPYEILSAIGAGGMGEVYRARDTRLERTVAIKVLPSHLSGDPELRQRFEREAKAVSALNCSHICTLHDIGQQGGIDYLVMEYLEGESLADRLKKGPLPLDQALRYATEIADALDKAHRNGVVHRDLKPGNIVLTKAGAKLLDFGLAKLARPFASGSGVGGEGLSALDREVQTLTRAGTLLGTFQYMAPEQLEGKDADARSDIFAFGSVLYEMLTGKRAFPGTSQASTIGAILKDEPLAISSIAPFAPPALDRVVKKCLAKDPEERWQSAGDLKSELQWIVDGGSQVEPSASPRGSGTAIGRRARSTALVALGLAAGFGFSRLLRSPTRELGTVRFAVDAPAGTVLETSDVGRPEISPDGRAVAFAARDTRSKSIAWVRPLDSLEAKPVVGTEGLAGLFWSPDGRSIGLIAERKWKRVDLSSGNSQTLCDAAEVSWGASWGSAGRILLVPFYGSGLHAVSAEGGTPVPVTTLDASRKEVAHLWPTFLPDGMRFLFFARTRQGQDNREGWICAASLGSKEVSYLRAADALVGASSDHLFFTIEGTLQAQRFDPSSLALKGEPRLIPGRVAHQGEAAAALASVSWNGILAFRTDPPLERQLFFLDRTGKKLESTGPPGPYEESLRLSPDGRRVVIVGRNVRTSRKELWLVDIARGTASRLGGAKNEELRPVWSPDGKRLLFSHDSQGPYDLVERSVDGSLADEAVLESPFDKLADDWSRDGKHVLYVYSDPKTPGLWVLPRSGDARPFFARGGTPFDHQGQFSPDGRWILFTSAESGRRQVYVRRFPEGTSKTQISIAGGNNPRWRGDGREIYFVSSDRQLMAVPWNPRGEGAEASVPTPLFVVSPYQLEHVLSYDVAPDGQRFLMITPPADEAPSSITVLLDRESEQVK